MREILFRAKCVGTGEWVEGWYAEYGGISEPHPAIIRSCDKTIFFVDRHTVGQFAGLTDVDGKKIFEGDIVRDLRVYMIHKEENPAYAEGIREKSWCIPVVFTTDDHGSCGCCFPMFVGSGFEADGVDLTECEVVGNVYDNPELLK